MPSVQSPDHNIISFLETHWRLIGGKTALCWAKPGSDPSNLVHDRMTYAELAARVEAVATGLARLGVRPGDRVFVFVPMSASLYVVMFAVQRLGAITVFLDSWARRDQIGMCAAQTSPVGVIAAAQAFPLIDQIPEFAPARIRVVVGGREDDPCSLASLSGTPGNCPIQPVGEEDPALVTFTTGSSGPPKGANRTHGFLFAQHRALEQVLPYTAEDIDLPVFPIFSLNDIAGGVSIVLPAIDLAKPAPSDGAMLIAQLMQTRATSCTLSPSLLRAVSATAAEHGTRLNDLRRVATGGAPVTLDDVQAFRRIAPNADVHVLYGSTEVEPIAHLTAAEMIEAGQDDAMEGVCVGHMSGGLQSKLIRLCKGLIQLGPEGWSAWELSPGEVGELLVSGGHVCRDYYNNPEAVAAVKVRDGQGTLWHRTGDLCRFDEQGRLWFVGRLHNVISRDGHPLFPVKPEAILKKLPFIKAAAYLGLPDSALGERAIAAFSLQPGVQVQDPRTLVSKTLADQGVVVDEVLLVDEIPLDPRHHSKVEYTKLRERLLAGASAKA